MKIAVVIVSRKGKDHDIKRIFVMRSPKKAFDWLKNRMASIARPYEKRGVVVRWRIYRSPNLRLYSFEEYEILFLKTQFFKMKRKIPTRTRVGAET